MPGPLYLQAAARNAEEEKAEMDGDMISVNSLIMEPFTGGHWAGEPAVRCSGPRWGRCHQSVIECHIYQAIKLLG